MEALAIKSIQNNERRAIYGSEADVFTSIFDEQTCMAVWQRSHSKALQADIQSALTAANWRDVRLAAPSNTIADAISKQHHLGDALKDDVILLADMLACLFDAEQIALRLARAEQATCPRFHIDHIPARMITTYTGVGTEWLENKYVSRQFLGRGNNGQPDEQSGLIKPDATIQQLRASDVALMKGEAWPKNEGLGFVHRSPNPQGNPRLMLTLDFA
ncbi:DUF1826 domain-containing protein [Aliidiomarina halalkaliphila]|uniref:DUF1826 domain-containing protein n=1 Tax=Aliidiomarina halalkaliphila TaxID=2593535 RepID=A0A552X583_9GAMM|nr:DUF1826 domain-containing protein [Aliidiomarina halalkaliphila]TRW50174.1 DUF1826 domain-containing protein [Aliidiomarina halalkaliphila]